MLSLKVKYGDEIRRISVANSTSFAELRVLVNQLHSLSAPFVLKYLDDDSDLVTINSESDLAEAIGVATARNATCLSIFVSTTDVPANTVTPTPTPTPTTAAVAAPSTPVAVTEPVSLGFLDDAEVPTTTTNATAAAATNTSTSAAPADFSVPVKDRIEDMIARAFFSSTRLAEELVSKTGVNTPLGECLDKRVVTPLRDHAEVAARRASECLSGACENMEQSVLVARIMSVFSLLQQTTSSVDLEKTEATVRDWVSRLSECEEARRVVAALNDAFERLNLTVNATGQRSDVAHQAICDMCNEWINGVRYKCSVCADFDLCEKCEASRPQHAVDHAFLKMVSNECLTKPHELRAQFVADVTIPDGTVVAPSVPLRKVWRVRNTGEIAWPAGCQIRLKATRTEADESDVAVVVATSVPVPELAAGAETEIAVEFTTPSSLGRNVLYYRLCKPTGRPFGDRLWTEMVVREAPAEPEIPEAWQARVENLVSMGFERLECIVTLIAVEGNEREALEVLLTARSSQ